MDQNWREQRRQERWQRRQDRWASYGRPNPLGGAIFGLLLIGGGTLFLLRNLGIVYFDNIWQYWPVILIAIGGSKLVAPRHSGEFTSGIVLTGIGAIFLLRNLGILYGNVWGYIWPAVFIFIGARMLLRHTTGSDWPPAGVSTVGDSDANVLKADALFGGIQHKSVSQAFEGGRVSVMFGGAEIDLRGATMARPEITLNADAMFGGIEIKVPEGWQIDVRGSGMFGGYEDKTHHPAPTVNGPLPPKLIVKGSAIFGGVSVRN